MKSSDGGIGELIEMSGEPGRGKTTAEFVRKLQLEVEQREKHCQSSQGKESQESPEKTKNVEAGDEQDHWT